MNRLLLLRPYDDRLQLEPIATLAPSIEMAWEVYRDTTHLVALTHRLGKEISWVGKVDVRQQEHAEVYAVSEIRVLPQQSTAGETLLDPVALGQAARAWMHRGTGENPCRFWGHTHVTGNPDPSPQDDRQMLAFVRDGGPPFFIRGIFCPEAHPPSASGPYHPASTAERAGTWSRADFSLYDYRRGVMFRHVPWSIVDGNRHEELAALVERCAAIVAPSTSAPTSTGLPSPDGATGTRESSAPIPPSRKTRRRTHA